MASKQVEAASFPILLWSKSCLQAALWGLPSTYFWRSKYRILDILGIVAYALGSY